MPAIFPRKLFKSLDIKVLGEIVGGRIGRSAEFNLRNGVLNIKTAI